MNELDIGFNAGRLCEAIARIGYEPDSAIMDIVDNSVSANARNIHVDIFLIEGKNIKSRNSVKKYRIIDDGDGMDEKGIKEAFSLGTLRKYEKDSLSKYGLGLKSAGLSLGTKISIVSKKNNALIGRYIFDKEQIEKNNKFILIKEELKGDLLLEYQTLLPGVSGTIVEIEGSESINHASPESTRNKLKKRLGVVYYSFLERKVKPLKLFIHVGFSDAEKKYEEMKPKDILFTDSDYFKKHWNPEIFDYYSPYLAFNEPWILHDIHGNKLPDINIQAVVFPQKALSQKHSPLSPEHRAIVSQYEISRENSGFFIYRNGRLIRWGDDLDGLLSKDDINIRIRLDIKSEHDDVLHVDVTKQRLEIDDENRKNLEQIMSKALKTAATIRELCQKYIKQSNTGDEGEIFTSSVNGIAEDDPEEITGAKPSEEIIERKKESAVKGKETIKKIAKEKEDKAEIQELDKENEEVFRKIIYSNSVSYGNVWEPHYDAVEGVFITVNKHHPYYSEFLNRFPENSVSRVSLEALMFSVGLAENNVIHGYESIKREELEAIFKKFHKNISSWLAEWSAENVNLGEE